MSVLEAIEDGSGGGTGPGSGKLPCVGPKKMGWASHTAERMRKRDEKGVSDASTSLSWPLNAAASA